MSDFDTDRKNGHDDSIDIDPRTRRALEEPLTVVALDGTPVEDADATVVLVVSHSGESYRVDARAGVCECPDSKHRDPDGGCKHVRRARAALDREPLDARVVAAVDVDETLGVNAPGPSVVATDGAGGTDIIDAGDDAEILDDGTNTDTDDEDPGRPDDCDCGAWNADAELPCWPCYRDGFEVPASAEGDERDDVEEITGTDTPRRSEPADFGGGESTGVQDL